MNHSPPSCLPSPVRQPERAEIEKRWQGEIVAGRMTYRDEPGNLKGEAELAKDLSA